MSTIVLKFGGSSVSTPQKLRMCAERAAARRAEGHQIVVVVSAMGDTTDRLVGLANSLSRTPSREVLDAMLATGEQVSAAGMTLALSHLGEPSALLQWNELGIVAEPCGRGARITSVDASRVCGELDAGRIVVVPGFVGRTERGALLTLGRGGSDTTAAAIAGALRSVSEDVICEIDTDVDGVFTADPAIVPNARRIDRISHTMMLELAAAGAHVLHPPSVEIARTTHLTMRVRDAHGTGTGTRISEEANSTSDFPFIGCALLGHLAMTTLRPSHMAEDAAQARSLLRSLGVCATFVAGPDDADDRGVRMIIPLADVDFLSESLSLHGSDSALSISRMPVACVSAVGHEIQTHPSLAAVVAAMQESWISVHGIMRTQRRFTIVVDQDQSHEAVRFMHRLLFEESAVCEARPISFAEPQAI